MQLEQRFWPSEELSVTKSDVSVVIYSNSRSLGRALPRHRADKRRCRRGRSGRTGIARSLINGSWLAAGLDLAGSGRSLSAGLGGTRSGALPPRSYGLLSRAGAVGLVTTAMLWNIHDLL